MSINWYPGHMVKTKRIIKEKLSLIDIIYEVIDARIPYSSKIKDIANYTKDKPKILIMTKIDLCDIKETSKWISHYKELGYSVITVDLIKNKNVNNIINITNQKLTLLNTKRKEKGLRPRIFRALIIGVPNVGKSTLINKIVGKKVAKVGNKPGITKRLEWIMLNKNLKLLDSPGVLWPKLDNDKIAFNLASFLAIKEEIMPKEEVAKYILKVLNQYYPNKINIRYNIKELDVNNIISIFNTIGKKRGCVLKGGKIDYNKVASIILNDLNNGSLGLITFDRYNVKEENYE